MVVPRVRSRTVMPPGVTGDRGNRPRVRASSLTGVRCTSLPSGTTRPVRGASGRDMERGTVLIDPVFTFREEGAESRIDIVR